MERPSWAKIIGALMILFAGCGVTQDVKQIKVEALTELSVEFADEISAEFGDEELDDEEMEVLIKIGNLDAEISKDSSVSMNDVAGAIKSITKMSPIATAKLILHGKIGIVTSLLYALAGLMLITMRKHVIKIVFFALAVSILFTIYQLVDLRNVEISKLFRMGINMNLYFGAFLDVLLLTFILLKDKSFFSNEEQLVDHYDSIDPL